MHFYGLRYESFVIEATDGDGDIYVVELVGRAAREFAADLARRSVLVQAWTKRAEVAECSTLVIQAKPRWWRGWRVVHEGPVINSRIN